MATTFDMRFMSYEQGQPIVQLRMCRDFNTIRVEINDDDDDRGYVHTFKTFDELRCFLREEIWHVVRRQGVEYVEYESGHDDNVHTIHKWKERFLDAQEIIEVILENVNSFG